MATLRDALKKKSDDIRSSNVSGGIDYSSLFQMKGIASELQKRNRTVLQGEEDEQTPSNISDDLSDIESMDSDEIDKLLSDSSEDDTEEAIKSSELKEIYVKEILDSVTQDGFSGVRYTKEGYYIPNAIAKQSQEYNKAMAIITSQQPKEMPVEEQYLESTPVVEQLEKRVIDITEVDKLTTVLDTLKDSWKTKKSDIEYKTELLNEVSKRLAKIKEAQQAQQSQQDTLQPINVGTPTHDPLSSELVKITLKEPDKNTQQSEDIQPEDTQPEDIEMDMEISEIELQEESSKPEVEYVDEDTEMNVESIGDTIQVSNPYEIADEEDENPKVKNQDIPIVEYVDEDTDKASGILEDVMEFEVIEDNNEPMSMTQVEYIDTEEYNTADEKGIQEENDEPEEYRTQGVDISDFEERPTLSKTYSLDRLKMESNSSDDDDV